VERGTEEEASVTRVHEDMIYSRVHIKGGVVKRDIRRVSTSASSVHKRGKNRLQVRPCLWRGSGSGRTVIFGGVGVGVPITHEKIVRREVKVFGFEIIKEFDARVGFCRGINISNLKDLPLEAKS
jgi:hypothetical protein